MATSMMKPSPRHNSVGLDFSIRSRKIRKADKFLFEDFEDDVNNDILTGVDIPKMKAMFQKGELDMTREQDYATIQRIYMKEKDFLNLHKVEL